MAEPINPDLPPIPDLPRENGGRRPHQNAADPDQVARSKKKIAQGVVQQREDWKWLAGTPQGRRLIAQLLIPLRNPSFDSSSLTMAFREGERSIAIWIHNQIMTVAPLVLVTLIESEVKDSLRENGQTQ